MVRRGRAGLIEGSQVSTRDRVLSAAVEVFIEDGYGASMECIATTAEVAKQTLYSHFESKEKLFAEVVQRAAESILVTLDGDNQPVRVTLLNFATAFRALALSPQGLGMHRALIAEAPRFPKLAKLVYERGPQATRDALAAYLQAQLLPAQATVADGKFAASMLIGMLIGFDRMQLLYGVRPAIGDMPEEERCEAIVDHFLRTFQNAVSRPAAKRETRATRGPVRTGRKVVTREGGAAGASKG